MYFIHSPKGVRVFRQLADDVVLSCDCSIEFLSFWLVEFTVGKPEQYYFGIQDDSGNGPDGVFQWQSTETNVTYEFFDILQGDSIWYTHIPIAEPTVLQGPATYWFCLHAEDPDAWTFWTIRVPSLPAWNEMFYGSEDNGATWEKADDYLGVSAGTLLILYGSTTSLERTSWSDIKATFI